MTSAKQIYLGVRRGAPTPPLPYDAEVEWLESDGSAFIDTGISLVESSDVVNIMMAQSEFSSSQIYAWKCSRLNLPTYLRGGVFYGRANSIRCAVIYIGGTSWFSSFGIVSPGGFVELSADFTTDTCRANNESGSFWSRGTQNESIILLPDALVRASSFSIERDGETIIDLTAVRFTNEQNQSEGAMYDRVSGALFRNDGTGAFLWAEKQ